MKVIVKDLEIIMAMHGVDDSDELDHAGFTYGWGCEMAESCGKIYNVHIYHERAQINGWVWHPKYLIILEDEDDL